MLVKNEYGRYGKTEFIHEYNGNKCKSYTKWIEAFPNISNEDYNRIDKYLNNLPSIQLSFNEYIENVKRGKAKGKLVKIRGIIRSELHILYYMNKTNEQGIENLIECLEYLLYYND